MNDFLQSLLQGNNPILILLAFLLFKDQIFSLFSPKPKPVDTVPVPLPGPAVPAVPAVPAPDRPVLDVVTQLLPVILPLIVKMLEDKKQDQPK